MKALTELCCPCMAGPLCVKNDGTNKIDSGDEVLVINLTAGPKVVGH